MIKLFVYGIWTNKITCTVSALVYVSFIHSFRCIFYGSPQYRAEDWGPFRHCVRLCLAIFLQHIVLLFSFYFKDFHYGDGGGEDVGKCDFI